MARLTASDKAAIEAAVLAAERRTRAEFVCVVAKRCGNYLYLPTLYAAAIVFVASGVVLVLPGPWAPTAEALYIGQVAAFIALSLALRWPPIKHRLVPRAIRRQHAAIRAHQLFHDLGLPATAERTGVMLFVALAEHYVEIIADVGLARTIDNALWREIIDRFLAQTRRGALRQGFLDAIDACADVLARHHPRPPDDRDELPNRLIEID